MTDLQTLLDKPIKWTDWTTDANLLSLLSDLQANILKGHGRDHTQNIFLSFDGMKPEQVAALLRDLSFITTSALEQLRGAAAFKATKVSGGTVICVMLSMGGYRKLGIAGANIPGDHAFREGMIRRGRVTPMTFTSIGGVDFPSINDPEKTNWEKGGPWDPKKDAPDAIVLIADEKASLVGNSASALKKVFATHGAKVIGTDTGLAQRRKQTGGDEKGEGIEHFGYVDGRSQPLFLQEDLKGALDELREQKGDPTAEPKWSERFKPSQFIVPDPGNPTTFSCGSYFVYRKLEQNVKKFKAQEDMLAKALNPANPNETRAGALVVGRFEDGTPVVESAVPLGGNPHNDFNYDADPDGLKCPWRAHIRKTNPRDTNQATSGGERIRLMARRGITYGERSGDFSDEPEDGVGLIFMAYMADINEQFEFTQSAWANNTRFPIKPAVPTEKGVDVVISQQPNGTVPTEVEWTDGWATPPDTGPFDFQQSVTLMGGEYFFAPSISFLQSAGQFVAPALIA